jgi:hypothetical protein
MMLEAFKLVNKNEQGEYRQEKVKVLFENDLSNIDEDSLMVLSRLNITLRTE